jgi:hypothetical protein
MAEDPQSPALGPPPYRHRVGPGVAAGAVSEPPDASTARLRELLRGTAGKRLTQRDRLALRAFAIVVLKDEVKQLEAMADQAIQLAWAIKFKGRQKGRYLARIDELEAALRFVHSEAGQWRWRQSHAESALRIGLEVIEKAAGDALR